MHVEHGDFMSMRSEEIKGTTFVLTVDAVYTPWVLVLRYMRSHTLCTHTVPLKSENSQ